MAEYLFAAVPISGPEDVNRTGSSSLSPWAVQSLSVEEHAVQQQVQRAAAGLPLIFCFPFGIRNQKIGNIFRVLRSLT